MQTRQAMLGRRQFVMLSAAAVSGAMLFGATGCSPRQEGNQAGATEATYKAGTYTAEAEGKKGPVKVQVTFSDSAIGNIDVVESQESRRVAAAACKSVPAQIIEHQSLDIDTITGATLTSTAIVNAVTDCVKQAGGNANALLNAPGPEHKATTERLDVDIVVIGAGGSGMAAAVSAAQNGARVAVFEKTGFIGGNAMVSGGFLPYIVAPEEMRAQTNDGFASYFEQVMEYGQNCGIDEEYLATIRRQYEDYTATGTSKVFDSKEFYTLDLAAINGITTVSNKEANELVDLVDWLGNQGFPWAPLRAIVGYAWPRWSSSTEANGGEGYFDLFENTVDSTSLPIDFLFQTPAEKLIIENGTVVGAVGTCKDGTTFEVRGSDGVILATGGYSGSPDLLRAYNTIWDLGESEPIPTTNAYGHTGDGIALAESAGGQFMPMDIGRMMFPFADAKDYSTETIVGDTECCLLVNNHAKRFVNESLSRAEITLGIMDQDNSTVYIISDSSNCLNEGDLNQFGLSLQNMIERGQLYRADSLAELASQTGLDATQLEKTVAQYNDYAKKKSDDDFGRTVFNENSEIKTPPFFASPRTWAAHLTIDGIIIDDDYRVITASGEPVEGLYAVGEVSYGNCGLACMGNGYALGQKLTA